MKKFWMLLVLAAAAGTATAWAINYARYGHRVARFGPFMMGDEVTADNVMAIVNKNVPVGRARVELVGDSTFDFGMMAPGTEGEHTFIIKSVGEDDVRLRLGATTCKCTLGELDQESLKPGEQTEVKLTWSVKQGESDFAQSAQLITNDPARVVIQLQIVGKVVNDIDIVPEVWTFGDVATGEPIAISGTIYSFLENDILPTDIKFSSEEITKMSEFKVEAFKPTKEADGIRGVARQGFRVSVNIKPGLRQGAVSQSLIFGFRELDENGDEIPPAEGDTDPNNYIYASTKGQIIGPLSMIKTSKISGQPGGGYVYDFGRIGAGEPLTAKTFVVLKGAERENTTLRIGEVYPDQVVKATLGEPKGRGTMTLYPLEIELVPGEEPVERLGNHKDDWGTIWIESDNPKVSKMRVALKFAIEGR
jgi:hypothetical protein